MPASKLKNYALCDTLQHHLIIWLAVSNFSHPKAQPIGKGWGTVLISAQTLGWLMFI